MLDLFIILGVAILIILVLPPEFVVPLIILGNIASLCSLIYMLGSDSLLGTAISIGVAILSIIILFIKLSSTKSKGGLSVINNNYRGY